MLKRLALVTMLAVWIASTLSVGGRTVAAQQQGSGSSGGAPQGQTTPPPAGRAGPGAAPGDAGQDQPSGQPTFRAGINFVRVDVIATDNKGNAILDLKPEDLTVTEDGKPQAVESFKLIKERSEGHDASARDPHDVRRGIRGAEGRRPAVRDLSRRLPRAARRVDVCAAAAHAF